MAKFGTTKADWQRYLQDHLKYPEKAKKDGIQGKVFVTFVVERDGRLSNIKVIRSLNPECDQEAIRIVKSSPLWVPARNHEKIVREQYTSVVNFTL